MRYIFPIEEIQVDTSKLAELNEIVQNTFRVITFSRAHLADDLLNSYLTSITNLKELLSIKNAQMEAQNEQEAAYYQQGLTTSLNYITEELKENRSFNSEVQLFQLFRLISPDSHELHPNRYRDKLVQIGGYICPPPDQVESLVNQLFHSFKQIKDPVIRSIYFHHELIRIHPFSDGNGRTTRIAKNWLLMYHLYPPIFVRNKEEKKEYLDTLGKSFQSLESTPNRWNIYLNDFFNQEIERLLTNARLNFQSVIEIGASRTSPNHETTIF